MLGVGIRGTGQVAVQHADAIQANPETYIAAVCGRSFESAKKFTEKYAPQAKVYANYEDMLADKAVDIVSECMPNYLHAAEAVQALEAGKHLILEKPAGINPGETRALEEAARKTDKKSVVSFVARWHPLIVNMKSLLERQALGKVYYVETDYWHGIKPTFSSYEWIRKKQFAGGAMITGGCHVVDIARYLNSEITEVFAYAAKNRDDFDYLTSYVASVKFANGAIGKISASLDGLYFPYQFNIDILGTQGACRNERFFCKEIFPVQNDWMSFSCPTPNSGAVNHHPFKEEINNLVDCILKGVSVKSDVLDACKTMKAVYAITESAETGKPVQVVD